MDRENVISGLKYTVEMFLFDPATGYTKDPDDLNAADRITLDACVGAINLLKEQEAREPHYTTLRYLVNGMEVAVSHPECPRCIENGLVLWDAEIEKGQAYCKRCGQAVKWDGN